MPIEGINATQSQIAAAARIERLGKSGRVGQTDATQQAGAAGDTFADALEQLDQMQRESDNAIEQMAQGEPMDLHQLMISVEQTDIAFRVALSLRDKLVEAYQEVMRMQV